MWWEERFSVCVVEERGNKITVGLELSPRAHRRSCENISTQRDHSSSAGPSEGVGRQSQRVDAIPQREEKQLFLFFFQLSALMVKC